MLLDRKLDQMKVNQKMLDFNAEEIQRVETAIKNTPEKSKSTLGYAMLQARLKALKEIEEEADVVYS
tara:strand:+ start:6337 stop:6537 length:201 start_codon:yes stop_codon:yes gene_type:complete